MTLLEGRTFFRDQLKPLYEIDEIDFYYKTVLKYFFSIEAVELALTPHKKLTAHQKKRIVNAASELKNHKPLQYIIGKTEFRSIEILLSPDVLIPRPETEELVEWILEDHKGLTQSKKLIDLGTGSGCIAIALSKAQSLFEVKGVDINTKALQIASKNGVLNQVDIDWVCHDLSHWETLKIPTDIIVSNPPYITPIEKSEMKKNVLDYEPHLALFVDENDPLFFYRMVLNYAENQLSHGGRIYFEVNPLFVESLISLSQSEFNYRCSERMDIFGKRRMLQLQKV